MSRDGAGAIVAAPEAIRIARAWRERGDPPLVAGHLAEPDFTDRVLAPTWTRSRTWWLLFGACVGGALVFLGLAAYSIAVGTGVWGNNVPVAWAFPIVNFVWWIGIGHAGTFVSAALLLLAQRWRTSINRLAEAMTLFALVNAAIFPILHMGRPWFAYWLFPYPSTLGIWPQFKSTLPWDVAAITTYFVVSVLFLYAGLLPDLAAARDRARSLRARRAYGLVALGWRGSLRQWRELRTTQLLLAGLAIPLVISEHSIVSLDFAITQLPGWHSTIFPPYFVAGAVFSGLGLVIALLVPVRHVLGLEQVITARHLDRLAKVLLATSLMLAYSYIIETFVAWYSASEFQRHQYLEARPFGPYAWIFWTVLAINVGLPQLFWSARLRRNGTVLVLVGLAIVAGMWGERFVIVVASLNQGFLPSSWAPYVPTWVDWGILLGSVGLFGALFLLFLRWVPVIALSEVRRLEHRLRDEHSRDDGTGHAHIAAVRESV